MIKYGTNLRELLDKYYPQLHLSRKKFMAGLVLSIIKTQSVKFSVLSRVLNVKVKSESNLRRIQDFFSDFDLNFDVMSLMTMKFIPAGRYHLSIDRTNWKRGEKNLNVLCLTIYFNGTGVPILFEMLDKRGNSNQEERIDLLDKFIKLFGAHRIASLTADREFIGNDWYKYLKDKNIPFYVRLPKSHRINAGGVLYRAETLLEACLRINKHHLENVRVDDVRVNIGFKKLPKGIAGRKEDDYLIVITQEKGRYATEKYTKRWSIETFFQAIKGRGFNIEQTHLTEPERFKKLFAVVSLAYVLCLSIGKYRDKYVKMIKTKNHGYKQYSFFRYGLNHFIEAIEAIIEDIKPLKHCFDLIDKIIADNLKLDLLKSFIT